MVSALATAPLLSESAGIVSLLINPKYHPLGYNTGAQFHDEFLSNGFCVIPKFFSDAAFSLIQKEAARLAVVSVRRDFSMPESHHSLRKMNTIGTEQLSSLSVLVPSIYYDMDFISFLSGIAGEDVSPVPDTNEQYVLNCLFEQGDTHGAHVDTYSFALNILTECPQLHDGGTVQLVPHCTDIDELLRNFGVILLLSPGDIYFVGAASCAHRVNPLLRAGRRVGLNLAYKSQRDTALLSYSSRILYA